MILIITITPTLIEGCQTVTDSARAYVTDSVRAYDDERRLELAIVEHQRCLDDTYQRRLDDTVELIQSRHVEARGA